MHYRNGYSHEKFFFSFDTEIKYKQLNESGFFCSGANCSTKFNSLFAGANCAVLLFVTVVGFIYAQPINWTNPALMDSCLSDGREFYQVMSQVFLSLFFPLSIFLWEAQWSCALVVGSAAWTTMWLWVQNKFGLYLATWL